MINLQEWFNSNKLLMNVSKTQFQIFFCNNRKLTLQLNNQQIERSEVVKLLGIYLNENFSWDAHVSHVCNRLNKAKIHFALCTNVIPKNCKKLLYYSYFYSILTYGISIWGPMLKKKQEESIWMIQKKFIRLIMDVKQNAHTDPLFSSLRILKLQDVIKLEVAKCAFKFTKDLIQHRIKKMYTPNVSKQTTRNSTMNIPLMPKINKAIFSNSLYCERLRTLMNMSMDLRNSTSIGSFVSKYKKLL